LGHEVLLVEDDVSVRESASLVLERAGFHVTTAGDGAGAFEALASHPVDLVVLDIMLPTMSGFDVCRELRKTSRIPIVMLTARTDTADIVAGLELGADDYVTKPFEPAELAARVRAVLRRVNDAPAGTVTVVRDVRIDEAAFRAFRGDDEIPLTAIEFRLLVELVHHAGLVMTRETLLERVWGYDYLGDSRLVDMAIKRLRDKLGPSPSPVGYITTVRGVGYRLERG
jgi:two-component system response regulator MtrA